MARKHLSKPSELFELSQLWSLSPHALPEAPTEQESIDHDNASKKEHKVWNKDKDKDKNAEFDKIEIDGPLNNEAEWEKSSLILLIQKDICVDFLPDLVCPRTLPSEVGGDNNEEVAEMMFKQARQAQHVGYIDFIRESNKEILYGIAHSVCKKSLCGYTTIYDFQQNIEQHQRLIEHNQHPLIRYHLFNAMMLALDRSVWLGHVAATRLLLKLYGNIVSEPISARRIRRWLGWCCARGHVNLLRQFPVKEYGGATTCVGKVNEAYWLSIHLACASGSIECVKYLLCQTPPPLQKPPLTYLPSLPSLPVPLTPLEGHGLSLSKLEREIVKAEIAPTESVKSVKLVKLVKSMEPPSMHPSICAGWPSWETDCGPRGDFAPLPMIANSSIFATHCGQVGVPVYATEAPNPLLVAVSPLLPGDTYNCLNLAMHSGNVLLVQWILAVLPASQWMTKWMSDKRTTQTYMKCALRSMHISVIEECLTFVSPDHLDSFVDPATRSLLLRKHRMSLLLPCIIHYKRMSQRETSPLIKTNKENMTPTQHMPEILIEVEDKTNITTKNKKKSALLRWYTQSTLQAKSSSIYQRRNSPNKILSVIFQWADIS